MRNRVTLRRLHEVLSYDQFTGRFTWRVTLSNRAVKGSFTSQRPNKSGHLRIMLDGEHYLAHVLAWFWMTGIWPPKEIDHRDLNGSNNRFSNLRLATKAQQQMNVRARASNRLGLKGVSKTNYPGHRARPYRARITVEGRQIMLGRYATPEEAHHVYALAAKRYFGEFARAA